MSDPQPLVSMWGYQQHFRDSLGAAAVRALDQVGAALAPDAFVVGFSADGEDLGEVVLVAGADDRPAFGPDDFAGVALDAKRRCAESPVHDLELADAGIREARHEHARDLARAAAVEAAMQRAGAGSGRTFFVGQPARVGAAHDVHPVLSVDTAALHRLPRLRTAHVEGVPTTGSLVHGVITELLRTATHALLAAKPPRSISPIEDDVPGDAVRRAAHHLVLSTALVAGHQLAKGLFDSLEALASTAYEGRPGSGTVVLAPDRHPHVDVAIRLRTPVAVSERLQFRKLLEMSDEQLGLLTDGTSVYGLGAISEQYDGSTEDLFRYTLLEQGAWLLSHHEDALLRVTNGHPALPRPRVDRDLFDRAMRRVFGAVEPDDIHAIWRLAQTAVSQGRGTALVVTSAAAEEACRLAPQALAIDPQPIGSRMLRALTRIDGAVLLSPDGICHAVGVILDGLATGEGDPGRGARYNSAVRYTAASSAPCLVLIVSDDGMIDVHPELD